MTQPAPLWLVPKPPPILVPEVAQAMAFFAALFPEPGLLHFRSVAEPRDGRPSRNHHYQLDNTFERTLSDWLIWCAGDARAAYVLPGLVDVGGTGKKGVLSLPCVVVDFDKGNTEANLAAAEALVGPATIVIESGGTTAEGTAKLHGYWKLATSATASAIEVSCRARLAMAEQFGGDPAFKQQAQVIRVPGSVHMKGTPTLVKLRAVRPTATYSLSSMIDKLGCASQPATPKTSALNGLQAETAPQPAPLSDFFDFNNITTNHSQVDRVMTAPIRAEGMDDVTRFEGVAIAIGHYLRQVRDGRMTVEAAWEAARGWNTANLQPPWPDSRLRGDFDRLVHIDVETHGPLVAPAPVLAAEASSGWTVLDWRADRFQGPAPARRWLVEGMIPLATPGLFAAVGDAGKSMLALRLALYVSCYPEPTNDVTGFNGTPRFFGNAVLGRGAAVVLTAEDDQDEVHRRIQALDPSNIRNGKPLYVVPMISTGGVRSILVDGQHGPEPTDFWRALRSQLLSISDLKLVVLDPATAFVGLDMNDNLTGAMLMTMLSEVAAATGAAIMLVHHFNKGKTPSGLSDARDSIRGAGALVDNGRWGIVMWEADPDAATKVLKTLGQKHAGRSAPAGVVYLGGLAKGNAPGAKTMRTLVRNATTGVLEDVTDVLEASTPRSNEVDELVHRALLAEKTAEPRWSFPISKNSTDAHIIPVLRRAGVDLSIERAFSSVVRLRDAGKLVRTSDKGRTLYYEPALT